MSSNYENAAKTEQSRAYPKLWLVTSVMPRQTLQMLKKSRIIVNRSLKVMQTSNWTKRMLNEVT